MSNTITLSVSASVALAGGGAISGSGANSITQSGTDNIGSVQNIGATTEQLVIGDVTTIGYLFVKNLDATNYVEFDLNTPVAGTAFAKLLPGESMLLPTRQTTIYAKANTAACDCLVIAFEL
jgi:hypothetical protein